MERVKELLFLFLLPIRWGMILEQNMFPRRKDRRPQIACVRSCGPFVRPVVLWSCFPLVRSRIGREVLLIQGSLTTPKAVD